jgi:hypothetical protein
VHVPALDIERSKNTQKLEVAQPVPASLKQGSKKYDDFMRFMEGIEEEMSSQYEKSSQRDKSKRDLEDFDVGRKQPSPTRKGSLFDDSSARAQPLPHYNPYNTKSSVN